MGSARDEEEKHFDRTRCLSSGLVRDSSDVSPTPKCGDYPKAISARSKISYRAAAD